jgi:peptidoglycan/xylan/chitin deacetylase (PgdA/CDA1 family)
MGGTFVTFETVARDLADLASGLARHGRYDPSGSPAVTGLRWPGGRKLAVYVAVGVEDYHYGHGMTERLLPGVPAPDIVNTSWRDYGNRVGARRLMGRLNQLGFPITVLLNTAAYDSASPVIDVAHDLGAEIVGHGVTNSDLLSQLTESEERDYLLRVAERIRLEEGDLPLGWSTPWLAQTDRTIDLLAETGYSYLLDLRPDDQPIMLATRSSQLLSIPYSLEINDSTSMIARGMNATDFADMVIDEFDELAQSADGAPLVMSIVLHSFISGVPFRLRQVTRALEYIAGYGEGVWLTRPREIYGQVRDVPSVSGALPGVWQDRASESRADT